MPTQQITLDQMNNLLKQDKGWQYSKAMYDLGCSNYVYDFFMETRKGVIVRVYTPIKKETKTSFTHGKNVISVWAIKVMSRPGEKFKCFGVTKAIKIDLARTRTWEIDTKKAVLEVIEKVKRQISADEKPPLRYIS